MCGWVYMGIYFVGRRPLQSVLSTRLQVVRHDYRCSCVECSNHDGITVAKLSNGYARVVGYIFCCKAASSGCFEHRCAGLKTQLVVNCDCYSILSSARLYVAAIAGVHGHTWLTPVGELHARIWRADS